MQWKLSGIDEDDLRLLAMDAEPELAISLTRQDLLCKDWDTNPVTKPSTYNLSFLQDVLGLKWCRNYRSGQGMNGPTQDPCPEREPTLTQPIGPGPRGLITKRTRIEADTTGKEKKSMK